MNDKEAVFMLGFLSSATILLTLIFFVGQMEVNRVFSDCEAEGFYINVNGQVLTCSIK